VEQLQAALHAAGYAAGPVDGQFGRRTRDGVYAFEKLHGLNRDGVVQAKEYAMIIRALRPDPPRGGHRHYLFVDLDRQLLFEVRRGRTANVVHVSTGGGYTYTGLDGEPHVATTPTGDYRVFRKVAGWDESYLGRLYYPSYYSGGYAVHGAASVPTRPVSHGCVRVPLWLAQDLFRRTPVGTPVFIR
jgi:peptidoglycan hydrolase-like protein with peptidoglycan-binding domain